jgi:hypothetical protein
MRQLCLLSLVSACAPARVVVVHPIPAPQRVEYRCDPWPLKENEKLSPALATRFLNEMGAKGWDSYVGNEQFSCFKRYVSDPPK